NPLRFADPSGFEPDAGDGGGEAGSFPGGDAPDYIYYTGGEGEGSVLHCGVNNNACGADPFEVQASAPGTGLSTHGMVSALVEPTIHDVALAAFRMDMFGSTDGGGKLFNPYDWHTPGTSLFLGAEAPYDDSRAVYHALLPFAPVWGEIHTL